jgi:hypothetical protein
MVGKYVSGRLAFARFIAWHHQAEPQAIAD